MKKRDLMIKLENNDERGAVFSGDYHKKEIFLLAEIKKGKSRGGHYHNKSVFHYVLKGKIIYKEIHLTRTGSPKNNNEIIKIMKDGDVINTPAYAAHLLIAKENSIVFETSDEKKETVNYERYRKEIESTNQ